MNDQGLMLCTAPGHFFSIAGRDEQTDELVIKVVNAAQTARKVTLQNIND